MLNPDEGLQNLVTGLLHAPLPSALPPLPPPPRAAPPINHLFLQLLATCQCTDCACMPAYTLQQC